MDYMSEYNQRTIEVQELKSEVAKLQAENKTLRNEVCLKCMNYRMEYKGACDGCQWK